MLPRKSMVVFLAWLRKRYSHLTDSQFFNAFSGGIYDFLECNPKAEESAGKDLYQKLVSVHDEFYLVNREDYAVNTRKLLEECFTGKYNLFLRDNLNPYIFVFLADTARVFSRRTVGPTSRKGFLNSKRDRYTNG